MKKAPILACLAFALSAALAMPAMAFAEDVPESGDTVVEDAILDDGSADKIPNSNDVQLLEETEVLPTSSTGLLSGAYYVPSSGLTLTGPIVIAENADVTIVPDPNGQSSILTMSGSDNIVVNGKLTINNIKINVLNQSSVASINLATEGAELYSDGMILTLSGEGTSSASVRAISVGIANAPHSGDDTVVNLKNSQISLLGDGTKADFVRGVQYLADTTGSKLSLDNTKVYSTGRSNDVSGASVGLLFYANYSSNIDVTLKNGSSLSGFKYALYGRSDTPSSPVGEYGQKAVALDHASIEGWAALYFYSNANGFFGLSFNATNSTFVGRNNYGGFDSNTFSVVATEKIVGGELRFSNCTLTAVSDQGAHQFILSPINRGTQAVDFVFIDGCKLNCTSSDPAFRSIGDCAIAYDETIVVDGDYYSSGLEPITCIEREDATYYYSSLENAVWLAGENETIKMLTDETITSDISISDGTSTIIDLNGHKLSTEYQLWVENGSALKIFDSLAASDPRRAGTFVSEGINVETQNGASFETNSGKYVFNNGSVLNVTTWCAPGYTQASDGYVVPKTYSITYNLDGGVLAPGATNPDTYLVTTADFTLNNPTRTGGYVFLGWTEDGVEGSQPVLSVTIPKGSTGDRAYTAHWKQIVEPIVIDPVVPSFDPLSPKPGATVSYDSLKTLNDLAKRIFASIIAHEPTVGIDDDKAADIVSLYNNATEDISVQMIVDAAPIDPSTADDPTIAAMNGKLNANEQIVQCFDLNITLVVTSGNQVVRAPVSSLDKAIEFILHIDPAMLAKHTARVPYVHDGIAQTPLTPTSTEYAEGNITISTKQFSLYGVALAPNQGPQPGPTPGPTPKPVPTPSPTPLPATGDMTGIGIVALFGTGAFALIVLAISRRLRGRRA